MYGFHNQTMKSRRPSVLEGKRWHKKPVRPSSIILFGLASLSAAFSLAWATCVYLLTHRPIFSFILEVITLKYYESLIPIAAFCTIMGTSALWLRRRWSLILIVLGNGLMAFGFGWVLFVEVNGQHNVPGSFVTSFTSITILHFLTSIVTIFYGGKIFSNKQ